MAAATDNIKIAKKFMKQNAIWWASSSLDNFGKMGYDAPVEIDCRWDDMIEQFINPNGETQYSRSKLIVDRDLGIKDKLKYGSMSSSTQTDPDDNDDVWEILSFSKIADRKGTTFLREVFL